MQNLSLVGKLEKSNSQKLNIFVKAFKQMLSMASKFLVVYFVYALTNLLLTIAFHHPIRLSVDIARIIQDGSYTIVSNNLLSSFTYLSNLPNLKYYIVCALFTVASLLFVVCLVSVVRLTQKPAQKQVVRPTFSQRAVVGAGVFSYKQHVSFLS